jgi:hypothetical protein
MVMNGVGKSDTNQGTELVVTLAALNNLSEILSGQGRLCIIRIRVPNPRMVG